MVLRQTRAFPSTPANNMAASNYYGYASGGQHSQAFTQVQNPSIQSTYGTPQSSAGYAVQAAAPTAGHYVPQQSQGPRQVVQPSGYSATGSTAYGQTSQAQGAAYGYTARQQDAPPPPPPTNTSFQTSHGSYQHHSSAQGYYERDAYDSKGSYYSSQPSSTVQAGQSGYYAQGTSGAAKTAYPSSGASAYSSPASGTPVIAKSHPQAAYTSQSSTVAYPYSSARTQASAYNHGGSYSSSNYGGPSSNNAAYHTQAYEAVVYNAAQAYVHQQSQHQPSRNQNWKNNKPGPPGGGGVRQLKPKPPPKQPQIHYCDVCKISCAGPQTYKEHLEGQKHKKKEAAAKQKERESLPANAYRCELCDVTCTGADAYAAHLKGSKHQKVVKLHQKLGKPIPETPPPKAPVLKESKDSDDKGKPGVNRNTMKKMPAKKSPSAPKITFVGGTRLTLQGGVARSEPAGQGTNATTPNSMTPTQEEEMMDEDEEKFDLANFAGVDKSKLIVGTEYLEEVKNDEGKVVSFHCKLCECKFNDPNAKEAHLAGRRHRLQFKKKVQPDLIVETKPSNRRMPKGQDDKMRRQWEQEQFWHWRREQEQRWHENEMRRWEEGEYYRRMEEERAWEEENRRRFEVGAFFEWGPGRMGGPPRGPPGTPQAGSSLEMPPPPRPRYDTPDDRLVMSKHSAVYPNEQELQAVQNVVSASEKALKLVSDLIAEQDNPQPPADTEQVEVKKEEKEEVKVEVKKEEGTNEEKKEGTPEENKETPTKEKPTPPRALKGVMRVGVLAKGLLLHERLDVNLVVLCHDKPTESLLKRVVDSLPPLLAKVTDEKYEINMDPENAGLTISTFDTPKVVVTITLTSPVMREGMDAGNAAEDPEVMDRQKCLDALASLRHAKWFQAKANGLQSCVVIIRIMRDMCTRVPAFIPLNSWAMELLVEKALSSSNHPLGPGEAFRRVMECLSSGVLQEAGPGLSDPCEKESVDPTVAMTPQEREDLTAAAQHALRLQAFRQLHKVLGVDPLPPPMKFRGRFGRGGRFKRRREDSGQGDEGAKKEKKEGEEGDGEPAAEGMEVAPEGEAKDAAGEKTEVKA